MEMFLNIRFCFLLLIFFLRIQIVFIVKIYHTSSTVMEIPFQSVNACFLQYDKVTVRVCWQNIPGFECESTIFLSAERSMHLVLTSCVRASVNVGGLKKKKREGQEFSIEQ